VPGVHQDTNLFGCFKSGRQLKDGIADGASQVPCSALSIEPDISLQISETRGSESSVISLQMMASLLRMPKSRSVVR